MREIKFRGKRKDTGKWVYGYLFKTPLTVENFEAGFIDGPERLCISDNIGIVYEIIKGTQSQYVDSKDKNKKDVYEGDIVKLGDGNIGTVRYFAYKSCGFSIYTNNGSSYSIGFTFYGENNQEVIGNIIDNPELLKKKEEAK